MGECMHLLGLFKKSLWLFCGVALALTCVWAQEFRGTISGSVTDPQGAVIPAASVIVTNVATNQATRTTTNSTGYFEATYLNPGDYSVSVEAAGFRKTLRTGLVLLTAGRLNLAVEMQVGAVAETLEVTGAAPLIDTATASGGRVIN